LMVAFVINGSRLLGMDVSLPDFLVGEFGFPPFVWLSGLMGIVGLIVGLFKVPRTRSGV
jgi:hypothetical protein